MTRANTYQHPRECKRNYMRGYMRKLRAKLTAKPKRRRRSA